MSRADPPPLILASGSPRRRELLVAMGIPFEVQKSTVDETTILADHPRTFALRAAFAKAKDVASRTGPDRWVLGADTVVTRKLRLYGKPRDPADAARMLGELSGETHDVITGMALCLSGSTTSHLLSATTRVVFRPLTPEEIDAYVATGEPMDKAGAYGIQGQGSGLIERIEGDYFNVVGLPCITLLELLREAGLFFGASIPDSPVRWRR